MAIEWLVPDGDGTTGTWTTAPLWSKIDDYSTVDGSFTTDGATITSQNNASGSCFVTLDATAATFTGDVRQVRIKITKSENHAGVSGTQDTSDLFVQLFKSDETTALTSEVQVGTGTQTDAFVTLVASGVFTKADWDGARLRLRHAYTTIGCADTTTSTTVTAVAAEITYTTLQEQVASLQPTTARTANSNLVRKFVATAAMLTSLAFVPVLQAAPFDVFGWELVSSAPSYFKAKSPQQHRYFFWNSDTPTAIAAAPTSAQGDTGLYRGTSFQYQEIAAPIELPAAPSADAAIQGNSGVVIGTQLFQYEAISSPVLVEVTPAPDLPYLSYPNYFKAPAPQQQRAFFWNSETPTAINAAATAPQGDAGLFRGTSFQYQDIAFPVQVDAPVVNVPDLVYVPAPTQIRSATPFNAALYGGVDVIAQDSGVSVSFPDSYIPIKRHALIQPALFWHPDTPATVVPPLPDLSWQGEYPIQLPRIGYRLNEASAQPVFVSQVGGADSGVQGNAGLVIPATILQYQAFTAPVTFDVAVVSVPDLVYVPAPTQIRPAISFNAALYGSVDVIPQDSGVSVSFPDTYIPVKRHALNQSALFWNPDTPSAAPTIGSADAGVQGSSGILLPSTTFQYQGLTAPVAFDVVVVTVPDLVYVPAPAQLPQRPIFHPSLYGGVDVLAQDAGAGSTYPDGFRPAKSIIHQSLFWNTQTPAAAVTVPDLVVCIYPDRFNPTKTQNTGTMLVEPLQIVRIWLFRNHTITLGAGFQKDVNQ